MTSTSSTTPVPVSDTDDPVDDPLDDRGPRTTGPALLLVPGWCGDRTVFEPVTPRLAQHRRVLVTDLRGHGSLAHLDRDFDAERQVEDLLDLVASRGLEQVVPVALSHAGWLAIELRRHLGAGRVPGMVLLDWMVLGPPPGFTDALAGLQSTQAWHEVRSALFRMWTSGVDHDDVLAYVRSMGEYGFEHWSRAGREIAASFAAESTPLEALAGLEPPCPTLHLYAQPHDDDYLVAQQQAAAQHPWFRVQRLSATSHFPTFEAPVEIANAIEQFACSLA